MANDPNRQAEKEWVLGTMYGMRGGGKSRITATQMRQRLDNIQMQNLPRHPLMGLGEYRWKGMDERFGVHRYHCNNSTMSPSHMGEELGTTGVRHSVYKVGMQPEGLIAAKDVCIIAWVKRHGTERMKEAVACALMLGHETIVIAHAFGAD
jgi:hypothetical protein